MTVCTTHNRSTYIAALQKDQSLSCRLYQHFPVSVQIPPDPTLTSTFTPVHPQRSLTELKSKPQSIDAALSSHNNLDTDWEMEVTMGSDRFTEQHHFSTQSGLKVDFYHLGQLSFEGEGLSMWLRWSAAHKHSSKQITGSPIPDSSWLLLWRKNLYQRKLYSMCYNSSCCISKESKSRSHDPHL